MFHMDLLLNFPLINISMVISMNMTSFCCYKLFKFPVQIWTSGYKISMLLYTGYKAPTPLNHLNLLLTEKRAKYGKTWFHKFYMKNKRSSEEGSQKVEHRAKRKSSTETVAPVECVFCGEKERDLSKMSKKQKLQKAGKYHTSFQSPNVQHVESL